MPFTQRAAEDCAYLSQATKPKRAFFSSFCLDSTGLRQLSMRRQHCCSYRQARRCRSHRERPPTLSSLASPNFAATTLLTVLRSWLPDAVPHCWQHSMQTIGCCNGTKRMRTANWCPSSARSWAAFHWGPCPKEIRLCKRPSSPAPRWRYTEPFSWVSVGTACRRRRHGRLPGGRNHLPGQQVAAGYLEASLARPLLASCVMKDTELEKL